MLSWNKRFAISFAHGFEFYNMAVYSAISVYISQNFFPESFFGENSFLLVIMTFALRFLARPIGGIFIGMYAERHGKKKRAYFYKCFNRCSYLNYGVFA